MGLVLLRGFVAVTIISRTVPYVAHGKVSQLGWILIGLSLAGAACLLAGFMTPMIAATVTVVAAILTVSGRVPPLFEVITLAITVALLGPGAYSLDARLFGRREILVSNTSRSAKS